MTSKHPPFLLIRFLPLAAVFLLAAPVLSQSTPAKSISLLPGFKAELLYNVPDKQGSWVSLAVDPKGRLVTSDQRGKLYRLHVDGEFRVEPLAVNVGRAHGLLFAFDSLYVITSEGNKQGLYRVRDTNGDDKFDNVKKLRSFKGGGEHGPHSVILGPQGKYLYIAAGNHTDLPNPEKSLVPRNWKEDQLLPRMWDAGGHAVNKMAPGGWICRTDPDGETFELVSSGYRNEFDIAFNTAGELFTFDADMEWDIGSPWYRPTRINHATSGSEFGWRSGTGKWPAFYPDSLPAVVDIGPGSPTGITFGTGAKFPAKYQKALFINDWSYGVMYAVHLRQDGASYSGTFERFLTAQPLPLTDVVIRPQDGAMYFAIGGRGTQSGFYRVSYTGRESTAAVKSKGDVNALARLRRKLETLHRAGAESAVDVGFSYLSHADRHIRYAARIAIEHQPVDTWRDLATRQTNPVAQIQAAIALARNGGAGDQSALLQALDKINWSALTGPQRLDLLRAYGLVFIRTGKPTNPDKYIERLDKLFPAKTAPLSQELCRLLCYLDAPDVVAKTLKLLAEAPTQQDQLHYVLCLRTVKSGWTLDRRRTYFEWFRKGASHRGGNSFAGFHRNIRQEAIANTSDEHRDKLKTLLSQRISSAPVEAESKPRKFVKKWSVTQLLPSVEKQMSKRSFEHGRKMFAAASCFKCHRLAGQGGIIGPDLTGAGSRFNAKNMLESLVEPSKVISDQYQSTVFALNNGKTVVGRVANLSENRIMVITNMLEPGKFAIVRRPQIDETFPSKLSMMPTGLLDTLTRDDILDLIAFLKSGGNPDHAVYK